MMKFEQQIKQLGKENNRVDKVINFLAKIKVYDSGKSALLDAAREVKAAIADTVRIIDGFQE